MVVLKFGVPDTQLAEKIKDVDVFCPNEEIAFGISAGCILCGKDPIVYSQDCGVFRCGNVILSLYKAYNIKLPKLILSIRHSPEHHKIIGDKIREFLDLLEYHGEIEIIEQKI